jgi:hypothetical protein
MKKTVTTFLILAGMFGAGAWGEEQPRSVIGRTFWEPSAGLTGLATSPRWMTVLGEANANYYLLEYPDGQRGEIWKDWLDKANLPESDPEEKKRQESVRRVAIIKAKKWPPAVERAVLAGEIRLGMTKEQVTFSQGEPKWVNRTITRNGTREQWVYRGDKHLYFDNGILTAWQD